MIFSILWVWLCRLVLINDSRITQNNKLYSFFIEINSIKGFSNDFLLSGYFLMQGSLKRSMCQAVKGSDSLFKISILQWHWSSHPRHNVIPGLWYPVTVRVTPVLTFLTKRTERVGSNLPWAAPPARLKKNLKTMKRKKPGVSGPITECHSSVGSQ